MLSNVIAVVFERSQSLQAERTLGIRFQPCDMSTLTNTFGNLALYHFIVMYSIFEMLSVLCRRVEVITTAVCAMVNGHVVMRHVLHPLRRRRKLLFWPHTDFGNTIVRPQIF